MSTTGQQLRNIAKRYHEFTDGELIDNVISKCFKFAKRGEFETSINISEVGPKTLDKLKEELQARDMKFKVCPMKQSILYIMW